MSRILQIGPFPDVPATIPDGCIVVTPHAAAARTLNVKKRTLENLARAVVRTGGLMPASPLAAGRILKATVRDLVPNVSPSSFTARIRQILETILRTGIDIEALRENGSPQIEQVARITAEYRSRLRGLSLIDPVEVLWEAAEGPAAVE